MSLDDASIPDCLRDACRRCRWRTECEMYKHEERMKDKGKRRRRKKEKAVEHVRAGEDK